MLLYRGFKGPEKWTLVIRIIQFITAFTVQISLLPCSCISLYIIKLTNSDLKKVLWNCLRILPLFRFSWKVWYCWWFLKGSSFLCLFLQIIMFNNCPHPEFGEIERDFCSCKYNAVHFLTIFFNLIFLKLSKMKSWHLLEKMELEVIILSKTNLIRKAVFSHRNNLDWRCAFHQTRKETFRGGRDLTGRWCSDVNAEKELCGLGWEVNQEEAQGSLCVAISWPNTNPTKHHSFVWWSEWWQSDGCILTCLHHSNLSWVW